MVTIELELVGRPARRSSVLIGDDNDGFRSSLAEHFAELGFDVREAGDGKEVLALARKRQPHLLLLDVRMPALSGLEAYRCLVAEIGRRLPAIFMTTGPTPEIRRQAQLLGAAALLDKVQLQLGQLQRLVAALLHGSAAAEIDELLGLLLDPRWVHELLREARTSLLSHPDDAGNAGEETPPPDDEDDDADEAPD